MYEPDDDTFDDLADEPDEPISPTVPKSSGCVVPMLDGRGNPYPDRLRVQQVNLRVAKAVRDRIDAALVGGPIRLKTVHLGDSGKAHFKHYLLTVLLRELYGDPIPANVKPSRQIVSPKALSLINRRMANAFNPPGGVLELPGVRLTQADLFDLLLLISAELTGDGNF